MTKRFLPFNLSQVFSVMLACISTTAAWCGTYHLEKGAGEQVCEAYRQNLEPRNDPQPMACERRYDSSIQGFAQPAWTELDLNKHFELFKKAEVYSQETNTSPEGMKLTDEDIKEMVKHLQQYARTWHVRLYLTTLRAGDGSEIRLLAIVRRGCGPDAKISDDTQTSSLYFVNKSLTDIDYSKQNQTGGWLKHATVELYNGVPYIERYLPDHGWSGLLTNSGALSVFAFQPAARPAEERGKRETGLVLDKICEIHFRPSSKSPK